MQELDLDGLVLVGGARTNLIFRYLSYLICIRIKFLKDDKRISSHCGGFERHKHRCSLFGRVLQAEQGLKLKPWRGYGYCHCTSRFGLHPTAAFPLQAVLCISFMVRLSQVTVMVWVWIFVALRISVCKVKTGVVGVPCGIEGSMVNEFVEALDS